MTVKIAGVCLQWSQSTLPFVPLLPKSPSVFISSVLCAASRNSRDRTIAHRYHGRVKTGGGRIRVSSNISLEGFFDNDEENEEEFVQRINELTLGFTIGSEACVIQEIEISNICEEYVEIPSILPTSPLPISVNHPGIPAMLLESLPGSVRVDLPLSPRILNRKGKQWEPSDPIDSACSIKKAFSFMVFIVREIQNHAIRMREAFFSPANSQIQEILARVHSELHASFVWLFHRIFSATPTLMICLMLLLANFTVFSIADYQAIAASLPPTPSVSTTFEKSQTSDQQLDIKTFSASKSNSVEGIASAWISQEAMSMASMNTEEATLWKGIVEEARTMQALADRETLRRFVSPVIVKIEDDDLSAYTATELSYGIAVAQNPQNPLLLSNFAQFLFTVHKDNDRAEEYYKRAAEADPTDAEALCRYANFLWVARSNLGAAEEKFLEAIAGDPGNSYYSANYANFLWNTGGTDTCYPLSDCDT